MVLADVVLLASVLTHAISLWAILLSDSLLCEVLIASQTITYDRSALSHFCGQSIEWWQLQ